MAQDRDNLKLEIVGLLIRQSLHVRAIALQLNQSHSTVARALIELGQENILDFNLVGKNKVYFLKKNLSAKSYVFRWEFYQQSKLLNQYPLLEPILNELLNSAKEKLILLFGSYAKYNANTESDIDIFIETKNIFLKKELEKINTKLSLKIGKFDPNSLLIKEIIKNHIILRGVEEYYDKLGIFE